MRLLAGLSRKLRAAARSAPIHSWREAQQAERDFWIRFIRDELGLTSRDQFVGFRLSEGRHHLSYFGFGWGDWVYSMTPPRISGKLLDVGSSAVSVFEKCRCVSVVAIDPSLEALAHHLPEIVVIGKINNCEYRCCRIQDVAETDFDVVWCNNVLDHTDDWQDIIRHFSRVLRPTGLLFLGTDVRTNSTLVDTQHISAFTADQVLAELEANGFQIVWQSPICDLPKYRFMVRATKRQGQPAPRAVT